MYIKASTISGNILFAWTVVETAPSSDELYSGQQAFDVSSKSGYSDIASRERLYDYENDKCYDINDTYLPDELSSVVGIYLGRIRKLKQKYLDLMMTGFTPSDISEKVQEAVDDLKSGIAEYIGGLA